MNPTNCMSVCECLNGERIEPDGRAITPTGFLWRGFRYTFRGLGSRALSCPDALSLMRSQDIWPI